MSELELSTRVEDLTSNGLRAMFLLYVTEHLFTEPDADAQEIFGALREVYDDLGGRFGITVLGTFDDDLLSLGPSQRDPIGYILADVPDLESVVGVVNLVRTRYQGAKLARYLRVEARVGRALFYGTK